MQQAQLGYFASPKERLELYWQQAALLAAQDDLQQAAQLGQAVFDSLLQPGVFGPGSTGAASQYGALAFRRPVMSIEFVPQVQTIGLTDEWGRRLFTLSRWYNALGDAASEQAARDLLFREIPNFSNIH